MNYTETIDYLFTKLPMFSRIGSAAYKKDLTNTIRICEVLDNPQHKFKSIHIAGTNGKGSTSHMLAAILQQAGYKTGLYTSPHLKDFRERIKINGNMIPKENVIAFTQKMQNAIQTIEPSFFEITVGMAFDYFASEKVDIAVIETGLGGRLDSTNVIIPILSIITNIGYDHQNLLGNTLELIAAEKAGIIKQNVPVVIGEIMPETKPIFEQKIKDCNATIYYAEEEIQVIDTANGVSIFNNLNNRTEIYFPELKGVYQIKNIKPVLLASYLLNQHGFQLPYEVIQKGVANTIQLTGLHGRWEIIGHKPTLILDVAHNVDGIKQLQENIANIKSKLQTQQIHYIIGMVKDKDIDAVLKLFPTNATYYFTQADIPRALAKEALQAKALTHQLKGNVYENVNIAINAAKHNASTEDVIIVCGSIFLVGEVET